MVEDKRDLLVLGGGPAGVAASIRARQLGAKVLLVEKDDIGGVCMNRGCVPTKCLMEVAWLRWWLKTKTEMGLTVRDVEMDWERLMARKEETVRFLRMGTESVLKSNGVEVIRGKGLFSSPEEVVVGERRFAARRFIVACGARWDEEPFGSSFSGRIVNTDWLLNLTEVPDSVTVLGSGPVELEAAQYLRFLGSEVTILEPSSRIMPLEDREMARRMSSILKEQGVEIIVGATPMNVEEDGEGLTISYETKTGPKEVSCSFLLHARRRPALEDLALDKAGLDKTDKAIHLDPYLATTLSHIFFAGDGAGEPFYSHRATAMGILAAENALGARRPFQSERVPRTYYTFPQLASVGMTESQAKERGYEVISVTIPYATNASAMIRLETEGALKIVSERRYGEVLGVHILGANATELISEALLAMELEATVEELAQVVRPHPSFSETLTEVAREVMGEAIYLLR